MVFFIPKNAEQKRLVTASKIPINRMSESSPSRTRKIAIWKGLFLPDGITEEDCEIRWVEKHWYGKPWIRFSDNDQQEPSESKSHVHVSQHRVRLEYIMMQQAFPEDFHPERMVLRLNKPLRIFTFFLESFDPLVVFHAQVSQ